MDRADGTTGPRDRISTPQTCRPRARFTILRYRVMLPIQFAHFWLQPRSLLALLRQTKNINRTSIDFLKYCGKQSEVGITEEIQVQVLEDTSDCH